VRKFAVALLSSVLCLSSAAPIDAISRPSKAVFPSCRELSKKWPTAVARDETSRTAYIKNRLANYYSPTTVIVRSGVYRRNIHLDANRNGVLCEEWYEQTDGAADAIDFFKCMLSGRKDC